MWATLGNALIGLMLLAAIGGGVALFVIARQDTSRTGKVGVSIVAIAITCLRSALARHQRVISLAEKPLKSAHESASPRFLDGKLLRRPATVAQSITCGGAVGAPSEGMVVLLASA